MLIKILMVLFILPTPKALAVKILKDKDIVNQAIKAKSFDPYLVLAVAQKESSKRVLRVPTMEPDGSRTYGLMQIKKGTARMFGFKGSSRTLYNWRTNLKYGSSYLDYQADRYGNDIRDTIAAYNAGTAIVCKQGWYMIKRKGKRIKRRCRIGNYINQGYVNSVWKKYKRILRKFKRPAPKRRHDGYVYKSKKSKRLVVASKTRSKIIKRQIVRAEQDNTILVMVNGVKKRVNRNWKAPTNLPRRKPKRLMMARFKEKEKSEKIKIMINGEIFEIDRNARITGIFED